MERIYIVILGKKCVSAHKAKAEAEKIASGIGGAVQSVPLVTKPVDNDMERELDGENWMNFCDAL